MPGSWKEPQKKNLPKQIDSLDCGIFMLMYALYIATGRAFDFSQEDMPKIRRWWCLLLLRKAIVKSQDFGLHFLHEKKDIQCTTVPSSMESVVLTKAQSCQKSTNLEWSDHLLQSSLIQNILAACDWLDANKDQLVGTVLRPRILEMDEDEVTYTIEKLEQRGDDEETKEVMSTLLFTFECLKDMNFFLDEIRVKKNIPISCCCSTN